MAKGPDLSQLSAFELRNKAYEYLKDESDRGVVLLSAVLIENTLHELIQEKIRPALKPNDDPLWKGNGIASNFSAKIELAYRLGIITREYYLLINKLRQIRNEFAHEIIATFEDQRVADQTEAALQQYKDHYDSFMSEWNEQIKSLYMENLGFEPDGEVGIRLRVRFINYIALVIGELRSLRDRVERIPEPPAI